MRSENHSTDCIKAFVRLKPPEPDENTVIKAYRQDVLVTNGPNEPFFYSIYLSFR